MKKVYVNEERCLGCHLCEYNCAAANSGTDIIKAFKGENKPIPRITVEEGGDINFAVQCRHCAEPVCVKSCITGALSVNNGVISVDQSRCVGCYTCILVCPYGALATNENGVMQKCELCLQNSCGAPACVKGCPNNAIVYEERGDEKWLNT